MPLRQWLTLLVVLFGVAVVPDLSSAAAPELGAPSGAEATAKVGPRADRYALPIGPYSRQEAPALELRGAVTWSTFRLEDREVTVDAVAEGYRAEIENLGLKTLLDCADAACGGFDFRFNISLLPAPAMRMDVQDFVQISAEKGDAEAYVSVLISRVLGAVYTQIVTVEPSGTAVKISKAPKLTSGRVEVAPSRPGDADLLARLTSAGHVQLDGVDFATGGAQLAEGSAEALEGIANVLKTNAEMRVVVVGHSDNEGGLDANIALSKGRADAVLEALISLGIERERLEARGVGFLSPLVSNDTPEGRAKNRRVEIVLAN